MLLADADAVALEILSGIGGTISRSVSEQLQLVR